jgi:hypothetical protein
MKKRIKIGDIEIDIIEILFIVFIVVIMILSYQIGVYNTIKIKEWCESCGLKFGFEDLLKPSLCQTIVMFNQTCTYCQNGTVNCYEK